MNFRSNEQMAGGSQKFNILHLLWPFVLYVQKTTYIEIKKMYEDFYVDGYR